MESPSVIRAGGRESEPGPESKPEAPSTDRSPRTANLASDELATEEDAGASEPSPSLAARIARSSVEGRELDELGTVPASSTSPVTDRQNTGSDAGLTEGDETAPRDGRVDAAGATFGPDPERDRIGAAAAGRMPPESVGGALGTPADADGLASAEHAEPPPTSGTSPG